MDGDMAGLIPSSEIKRVQVDPFMEGSRVAVLCDGILHVSPAMYDALHEETELAWRSLRVLYRPTTRDLMQFKRDPLVDLEDTAGLEWPAGGKKIKTTKESNPS